MCAGRTASRAAYAPPPLSHIALHFHLQFALATAAITSVNSLPSDISLAATASTAAVRATPPMTIHLNSQIAAANVTTIPLAITGSESSSLPVQIDENLSKLSSSTAARAAVAATAKTTKSHSTQATLADTATTTTNNNSTSPIAIQKKPLWQKLWPFANTKSSLDETKPAATATEGTTTAPSPPPLPSPAHQFTTKEFKVPFSFNPSVTHQFNALFSFSKMPHKKYHHHDSYVNGDTGADNSIGIDINQSTYDDINREQLSTFQQDQSSYQHEYDGGLKVKWQRLLHHPVAAWHKVQKWGVDAAGLGPLYGTGEFDHKKHHHNQERFD